jgi:excisionase family DNA binding protein
MGPDDILSTTEVAAQIGVARQTVDRWIRDGRLRARRIQVGKRAVYRVRRRDVYEFVRRYVSGDW